MNSLVVPFWFDPALALIRGSSIKVRRKFNRRARSSPAHEVSGSQYKSPGQGQYPMILYDYHLAEIEVSYSHRVPAKDRLSLCSSDAVQNACRWFWPDFDRVEYFYILLLDRSNKLLGFHQLSKGGITGTVVDVRVILGIALKTNACNLICAHNHPSGNLTPSDNDLKLTHKIKDACRMVDINLLDHVILSSDGCYSMADNGVM